MPEIIITVRGIDEDTWLAFRGLCLRWRTNVGDGLNEAMTELLEPEEEK